ncbi:MAG: transglycosylase domain-containing protein [Chloroflexota bacterium]
MQNPDPEDPTERFRRLITSEEETQLEQPAEDVTPDGETRLRRRPVIDEQGMPLPRRVEEVDLHATQVSPAAYNHTPPPTLRRPRTKKGRKSRFDWPRVGGCLLRGLIISVFVLVALALILVAVGIYQYYSIAATLPSVADLRNRASQFETTRILDRDGAVIYEILDPNAGRRTYVSMNQISPYMIAAIVATEDKDFYSHPGIDIFGIVRAFWQNYRSGETVSGASTITQQVARMLLMTPEERSQRTYARKLREAILATEITRRYSKDDILELYLNESYFGNLAYGVEAAAQTYFQKSASELTMGEAAFLAGLPQAPAVYDIYTNPEDTLHRMEQVIVLMYRVSQEYGCIYVSNNIAPICVDVTSAALAAAEIQSYPFEPPVVDMPYPHWAVYVRMQLEALFDPQTIYRSGFTVTTSLDPELQEIAQQIVSTQVAALADRHVTNGALVAIRPSTGEVLALIGSADFNNEAISGQVNMAVSPTRQPGSSIKPITYLAAFERGWTPATLIWDVPSEFPPSGNPNDPRPPYIPINYDERFHGPVTLRSALANSYNIPAVKTLFFVGIYDIPETPQVEGMIAMAQRLGITSLTRNDYGLSLTLGGGEVSLFELTGAYAVIANGGRRVPPVAILKIVDHFGNTVYEYETLVGEQVIRPEHAFLMSSILSDNTARAPMFGASSLLNLPFQAAAKTGTTNDFRDNWTLGYTPDLAVGVWVGNADYTPMVNTTGLSGAAPIWSQFMMAAVQHLYGGVTTPFIRPAGIVEHVICSASGTIPSTWCPSQRIDYFAADQPPLSAGDDLWKQVLIDTWTRLESSPECSEYTEELLVLNVTEQWARNWIHQESRGQQWARDMGFEKVTFIPERQCNAADPHPRLQVLDLVDGQRITDASLAIRIVADVSSDFRSWRLEYGLGDNPTSWNMLTEGFTQIQPATDVYSWDLSAFSNEVVTLRLSMTSTRDGYAERKIRLRLEPPTPTPTLTPTLTWTPTQSPSVTPTMTGTPTQTPTVSPTPTSTNTQTPSPTP